MEDFFTRCNVYQPAVGLTRELFQAAWRLFFLLLSSNTVGEEIWRRGIGYALFFFIFCLGKDLNLSILLIRSLLHPFLS